MTHRFRALGLAAAALAVARLWIALMPGRAIRWASSANRDSRAEPPRDGVRLRDDLARAVAAVAARPVVRATCLEQGLALVLLLSIVRVPAQLIVGVSRDGMLRAHAWVESGSAIVLGAPAAGGFARLPPPSPTSCPG